MEHYKNVIIGATLEGLTLIQNPDTLVIEQGTFLGSDCTSCYNPCFDWSANNRLIEPFFDSLVKRNAVSDGRVHLPAVLPVLTDYYKDKAHFLMGTAVTNIEDNILTLSNRNGVSQITCDNILDMRQNMPVSYNFLIHGRGELPESYEDIVFYPLRFDNLAVGKFATHGDVIADRNKIHTLWEDRPHQLKDWRIISYAPQFEAERGAFPEVRHEEQYDVIVAGLGAAGSMALINLAKKGFKVLGIEEMNCMGGTATAGGVMSYYYGSTGGMYEQLDKIALSYKGYNKTHESLIQADARKVMLETVATESKADICYNAVVTEVTLEDKTIKGVSWRQNGRIFSAAAKYVIDCTADGFICKLAGCEMRGGRESDGQVQPYSVVKQFVDSGIMWGEFRDNGFFDPFDHKAYSVELIRSTASDSMLYDSYDDKRMVTAMSALLGVREGHFIVGEETLSLSDFYSNTVTKEPLFYAYSNIDNHCKDLAFEDETQQDWAVAASLWGLNFTVPVSLDMLIPKGYKSLVAAGRCISVTHDIAPLVRMLRDMQKCGEAAAEAVALAIESQCDIRNIDYSNLSELLRASGCLDEKNNIGLYHSENIHAQGYKTDWLTDIEQIKRELATDSPGMAIWSCRRLKLNEQLKSWLDNESINKNAAIALGIMGDTAGADLLRQMAQERDGFLPKTSRRYNSLRGVAAVYLLGRLADKQAIPILFDIMRSDAGMPEYTPDEFISDKQEVYFQFFSHALMALSKIKKHHPDKKEEIEAFLSNIMDGRSFYTSYKRSTVGRDMTEKLKRMCCADTEET